MNTYKSPATVEEFLKLQDLIEDHEAYKLRKKCLEITRSRQILTKNSQELIFALTRFSEKPYLVYFSAGNENERDAILVELCRLFHNFVASVKSLVDHTRKIIEELYLHSSFLEEYRSKLTSDLINEPLVKFVQDLRNLVLHSGLAPLVATIDLMKLNHEFKLSIKKLKEWSGWTGKSKEFLDSRTTNIELVKLVEEYIAKIDSFYEWLNIRQKQLHVIVINDLTQLENLYFASSFYNRNLT